ncbi:hypothetical protein, partial [Pseudomonas aeruginosa]
LPMHCQDCGVPGESSAVPSVQKPVRGQKLEWQYRHPQHGFRQIIHWTGTLIADFDRLFHGVSASQAAIRS